VGYKAAAAVAPARPQAASNPQAASKQNSGFLGAPVAQVDVLTPPSGIRYDSDFAGPETTAWSRTSQTDSGEFARLEEYWAEDTDVEYSALLSDLDDDRDDIRHDTGAQSASRRPSTGRRRAGSGDRRLWFGLGGVMAVAAAAIFLIIQFEFPSASGPTHTLSIPDKIGSYAISNAVGSKDLTSLRQEFVQMTHGQATDVLSGAFQAGGPTTGGTPEIVMTIDAHLANDNASSSIAGFMSDYKDAAMEPAGPLGGQAACAESAAGTADNVAICAWFDNDSFGVLVSPSMNAKVLAGQLQTFRSAVEHVSTSK